MNILVVGLGSIGRRHLGNLRQALPDADITVWRQHARPQETGETPPEANRVVYSLEDALARHPQAAVIANPAPLHISTALDLAEAGVSLLVEKPFSNSLEGVNDLISLCKERSLTLMVAYNLRFHPALIALQQAASSGKIGKLLSCRAEVGQYLPDWRPNADYRRGVSARADLGGGAVLELSHELDYTRWIMGEVQTVSAQTSLLSGLEMDVEDTAEITLKFTSGAFGSVHVDMIQRTPARTCKLIGSEGTLVWDGLAHTVKCFSAGAWEDIYTPQNLDRNGMYIEEIRHFLHCVRTGETPLVSGEDGKRVLEIALAARRSSQTQSFINIRS